MFFRPKLKKMTYFVYRAENMDFYKYFIIMTSIVCLNTMLLALFESTSR